MPRFLALFAAVALAGPGRADEPVFNGRTLAGWADMVKSEPNPRKRRAAVVALGQLAGTSAEARVAALTAVGKALRADASPAVREQAAGVLGQQPPEDAAFTVTDLAAAVREEKVPAVRRAVAVALGRFGPLARPAAVSLTGALADADDGVKVAGAEALGRVGPGAAEAAPELARLTRIGPAEVRRAAVFALGRVEPTDKPAAAAAVVAAMTGADAGLRADAVTSLGLLGVADPAVVAAVSAGLTDPSAAFRSECLQTLGRFGGGANSAVTAVDRALQADRDVGVRVQAVRAVRRITPDDAGEVVRKLAGVLKSDPAFEVRVAVAHELGGLGSAAKPALPVLRSARGDAQSQVREAATIAVRRIEMSGETRKN